MLVELGVLILEVTVVDQLWPRQWHTATDLFSPYYSPILQVIFTV
jgi:hypothetical protein